MKSRLNQPWIPMDRIEAIIQLEPALIILGLTVGAWLVYKLLLRDVSAERHRNLRALFANLAVHLATWLMLLGGFMLMHASEDEAVSRIASYVGMLTILAGAAVFVKVWRILVFEYLFLGHMRVGVPVLLVNLSTLVLSMIIGGWLLTEIFGVRLAPLLATSAIFSLVLGLALQDTLGNLFAGVALQFDKPYEIGDWVEVQGGSQVWVGQVQEISWRATVLLGWSDEAITIPNRVMAQAQISNFATKSRPILRRQVFRVPFDADPEKVRRALARAAARVHPIRKDPAPSVIVTETHESWIPYKLLYFIDDYGIQYAVADDVISYGLEELRSEGISLASPRLELLQTASETV